MARFKLILEYAGTRYSGWQIQANARSVQGEIATAVRKLSGRSDFELYGSGRTDAGVHALRQVAHLDLNTPLKAGQLRFAINDLLPADINVLEIQGVSRRFHARHDAQARSYLYQISRRRTAFGKPFVWWIKDPLDAGLMQRAASLFVGMHDFRSFTAGDPEAGGSRVLVDRLEVGEADDLVLVRMLGSHFVWKMVRRVVGVLAEVGRGGIGMSDVSRFLNEYSDVPAQLTAPPSGLFLERVFYEGEPRELPLKPVLSVGSVDLTSAVSAAPAGRERKPWRPALRRAFPTGGKS
jgi:tRNA pseudouridine38-40 synthase